MRAHIPGLGDLCAALAPNELSKTPGELALGGTGKFGVKHLGNGEPENPVAQKLQSLIALPAGIRGADMGQRLLQEFRALESIVELGQKLIRIWLATGHGLT
jgi:hypothetical protein